MSGRFAGKSALVTGGASGIGRAIAEALVHEGARVLIVDVAEAGAAAAREMGASFARADVSRELDVATAVAESSRATGRLDVAVNAAGIEGPLGRIADLAEADFDRVIAVNLKGVFLSMKHEIRAMGPGSAIVNVASVAGLSGMHGAAAYAASKHGVVGLTRTASLEYARKNVRVNAVCPGVIETPMTARLAAERPQVLARWIEREPAGRLGKPAEVASAALWLASDEAAFVTGAALPVDGGWLAE